MIILLLLIPEVLWLYYPWVSWSDTFHHYERGGNARPLAYECKFLILVSLRVFWAKRHHNKPWRSRLGLQTKKYKNICIVCVLTWSLLGVKKCLDHAQISLLKGFNLKFSTSIPTPFICGVPPPPPGFTGFRVIWHSAFWIQRSAKYQIPLPLLSWDEFAAAFEQLCVTEHNNVKVLLCCKIPPLWLMLGRQFLSSQVFYIL